jgi:myo-inositol-1(or 4)-monophosphatase
MGELLMCAVAATQAAADHAMRNVSRRNEVAKRFKHDVKLQLDIECQAKAEEVVQFHFPSHAIIGEEDSAGAKKTNTKSDFTWIIDPIDGTVNFSHGLPFWCCSVAVRRNDEMQAGAVYSPALNELYTAFIDGPALCNGERLHVSKIAKAADSIVCTGLDKNISSHGTSHYSTFEKMWEHVQRGRIIGCAALDICRVASGQADAYFESGVYIWDVAAAGLIVRQAGGKVEILEQKPEYRLSFLATNGRIHREMKKLVTNAAVPKESPAN